MHLALRTLTQTFRNHSPLCLPHDGLFVTFEVPVVPETLETELVLVGGLALDFQSSGTAAAFFEP